jgi:protein-S-isoprenylcysteine O-methyltransferase Ste14
MQIDENSAKVRFPPPLVFIGFLLIAAVIDRLAGLSGLQVPLSLRLLLASAAIGFGLAVGIAAIGRFRRAGTPPQPWREVTALVTTGVYRFTRNPMYLGMASIYLGLALAIGSIAALALLPVVIIVIQAQVIVREEAYMTRAFGAPYADYRKRVRRWL